MEDKAFEVAAHVNYLECNPSSSASQKKMLPSESLSYSETEGIY